MQIEEFDQTALLSELKRCFNSKELEELAKENKFIRRNTSRLTGTSFLMMNVFDTTDGKERTLDDSCDWLEEHFGIIMTKQSLDERYNFQAVDYIKACFYRVLEIVNSGVEARSIKLPFVKIQLTDATSFKIPKHLSSYYKGNKGNGGKAVLKIHLNYDFLTGEVEDILLTDGVSNDSNYKLGEQESIITNALYVRDLGYYDLKHFMKLDKAGAYFLSRGKTNCAYSIKNEKGIYERVDIADYLPKAGQTKDIDEIYLGSTKNKLKVRLVLQAVPKEVAEQRLKKLAQYDAKHKKGKVSEQRKAMCHFNVFITNIPADIVTAELLRMVYTLRWQIELLFKIWKSVFNIDKVRKMNIFRFECYIYSKLIAILLTLHIHNKLGQFLWEEEEIELSPMKAAKLIKKKLSDLMDGLLTSGIRLRKWFDKTVKLLIKRGKKHARKLKGEPPKPSAWDIVKFLA